MAVETITVKLDANTRNLVRGMSQSTKSVSSFATEAKTAAVSIKGLVLAGAGLYGVKQAFDALASAARSFVSTSAQFEQYETVLRTITGSSEQAKQSMSWIKDFAASTPFNIEKVTESFVKLKAYGIDPIKGDTLRTLGDTAAAMGKDVQQAVEAMADAITGENERLKEFGIKASVQGDKIAYKWSDSSGKARNIVIKNNKDMIQSTLQAIWNEKYGGAMAAQSKTWNGLISNIQDQWTNFKASVMSSGLFDYLKAIAGVVGDHLKTAFGSSKKGAIEWSKAIISGIESTIKGAGILNDTFSLFGGVFSFIKSAFWEMVGAFGSGINAIQKAWNKLGNTMSSLWATVANGIKDVFATMINWIIDKINSISSTVNKAANAVGLDPVFGNLSHISFKNTKANITELGEPISNVATAWQYAKEAHESYKKSFDDFANGSGQKQALKFIGDIKDKLKDITATEKVDNKIKEEASNTLDKLGAKYGDFAGFAKKSTKATKSAAAAVKKYASELKKAQGYYDDLTLSDKDKGIKELKEKVSLIRKMMGDKAATKAWEEGFKRLNGQAESFADKLQKALGIKNDSLFSDLYQNLTSSLSNIGSAFNGGDAMDVAMAAGQARVDGLNTIIPGLGDAVKMAGDFIGGLFSDSAADFKRAAGRSDFGNKALTDIRSILEKNQAPQLTATRKMLEHIVSMDNSFDAVAAAISTSAGIDISGQGYTPKTSGVLGGLLYAKSTELLGSGLQFGQNDIASIMDGQIDVVKYQAEKVTKSFLGIINTESVKNSTQALSDTIKNDLTSAINGSIDAVSEAVGILGFDVDAFKEKLNNYALDIGKLNFKDLDPKQQAEALKSAIGESLSQGVRGALSSIADPQMYQALDSVRQAGEDYITTLVRVGITHETVKQQLAAFGQSVQNFAQSEALVQAAGGLDKWKSAMDQFVQGFFTAPEQKAFLQNQLQYALSVYDIALPASKAQFKALVLETQQKIIATKAKIQAMKAEIAAQVAAGKITLAAAYGELEAKGQIAQAQAQVTKGQIGANNALIRSAHNAGQAAVGFGHSVHNSIKAMAGAAANAVVEGAETAVDEAGNIDYSRITSPAIQAAQGELSKLEGLYGTLMSQMGSFSSYYNNSVSSYNNSVSNTGDAASKASKSLDELSNNLLSIASMQKEWGIISDVDAASIKLAVTQASTGLYGVTYANFAEKFKHLTQSMTGLDSTTLKKWQQMSEALKEMHDAQDKVNADLRKFKERARDAFTKLFTIALEQSVGDLTRAINRRDYGQAQGAYSQALGRLEATSMTREDYFLSAARLNDRIQRIKPESPNKGIELRLDKIAEMVKKNIENDNKEYNKLCQIERNTCPPPVGQCQPIRNDCGLQ